MPSSRKTPKTGKQKCIQQGHTQCLSISTRKIIFNCLEGKDAVNA